MSISLDFNTLRAAYRDRALDPVDLAQDVLARIEGTIADNIWIARRDRDLVLEDARRLAAIPAGDRYQYPLYGLPFAVKDCIDVAGLPTTAACPEFAYTPEASAASVERILAAGAICLGKTNLDQFATGLVGVRTPYGIPKNPFNAEFIPGGSSSGSAVAVSCGLVSFALGTDTGGSGRVPASYTNTIGLKPTVHRISARGMVHACKSFDCISIYALTPVDASDVLDVVGGLDPLSVWSRETPPETQGRVRFDRQAGFSFGVPRDTQLEFFGDSESARLFEQAVAALGSLRGRPLEIDYGPFLEANEMMFQGPLVAERLASVGAFLMANPGVGDPTVRAIIEGASRFSAADAFQMFYRLRELRREIANLWAQIDVLVLPTVGRPYRIADLEADPVGPNFNNGTYTNFANPLDVAVLAIPNGVHPDGVPMGITLNGPAFSEATLIGLGERFWAARASALGATNTPVPPIGAREPVPVQH